MTTAAAAKFWVTCADYRRGPFSTEKGAEGALRAIEHSGHCPLVHRVESNELVMHCDHASLSGVDQTPLDDPKKVWRCDECDDLLMR